MKRIPERSRPLVIVATGVVVLLLVAGGVLLLGQVGPGPTASPAPSSSVTPLPSPDASTPEAATRAFFEAFADARRTDDSALVVPFVTGTDSSAYRTVDGFLAGQREEGKASIVTTNELSGFDVEVDAETATVTVTQVLGGYDIDLNSGEPIESPTTLPPTDFRVVLLEVDGNWLVDEFEALE